MAAGDGALDGAARARGDSEGVLPLTPKHVQALKALLNIAHCLGNDLGTSWHTVLHALEQVRADRSALSRRLSSSEVLPPHSCR